MCNCQKKGLHHWWKYLRFRLHWRDFWTKMRYEHVVIDGEDWWVETTWTAFGYFPVARVYDKYPGPAMTPDEYEHWFPG